MLLSILYTQESEWHISESVVQYLPVEYCVMSSSNWAAAD